MAEPKRDDLLYAKGVDPKYIKKLKSLRYYNGNKGVGDVLNMIFKQYFEARLEK